MSKKRNALLVGLGLSVIYIPQAIADEEKDIIVVTATTLETAKEAGTKAEITAQDMQKNGGNDFSSIMRYQPLISASGSVSGSSTGKSSWDRGGNTGYNIRGLEANRVAIEVDGISQPIAQGRVNSVGRSGFGNYGIGRDYLDPYMYDSINIESGATSVSKSNNALGGLVSFAPKSGSNYLSSEKDYYLNYQSDYDSSNKSWHNGITSAIGDKTLNAVFVLSRRDGQETRNNSDYLDAYPENWHSNGILAGINWQATPEHQLKATLDFYERYNHSRYDTWNNAGTATSSSDHQDSKTKRLGIVLKDLWTPSDIDWIDAVNTQLYYQKTKANDSTDVNNDSFNMKNNYKTDTYGLETNLYKNTENHSISTGLNAKWVEDQSPFSTDAVSSFPGMFPDGDYSKPQADSRAYTIGGFFEDRITIADVNDHNLYLVTGVRVLYQNITPKNLENMSLSAITSSDLATEYKSNSDFQVLPSLALMYDLKPNLMMYLQYKRGAQMPNANQLYGSYLAHMQMYALVGNSDLKTETSDNFEFGLKGQPTDGITLSSSLFYNKYKNFIAYTRYRKNYANSSTPKIIYQSENRDRAYIYGIELNSKFDFGKWFDKANGLSARFAIGYSKGASESSYLGDKYVDLDTVPPMKAIVGLAWDDPNDNYGAAITATFQKGKKAEATNRNSYNNNGIAITTPTTDYFRVPGQGVIDLTAYVNVTKDIKIHGGIYNLTDKKYWDYLSNNKLYNTSSQEYLELSTASGRTFQLGINIDF